MGWCMGWPNYRHKKAAKISGLIEIIGGGGGIRTLEALRLTHFPGVLLRPLGHPSAFWRCRKALPFATERRTYYGLSLEIASLFRPITASVSVTAAPRNCHWLPDRASHHNKADGLTQCALSPALRAFALIEKPLQALWVRIPNGSHR